MKLMSLTIRNFKGIEELTIEFNGNDVSIYGDNETGKTTLYDAYTWLLFGKDSAGQTEFSIKPLDRNNEVIPGLSPTVSAIFIINNSTIELCKVHEEKWVKKRGSAQKIFSGHQTKHYINHVPVSKTEYEKQISSIIPDKEIFWLLSDPKYFNIHLSWQERRKYLIEKCGDISDAEIISSNNKLAKLPELLDNRTISQHQEMLKDKRKSLEKEINSIPSRIFELTQSLYNHSCDPEKLKEEISDLEKTLYKKQNDDSRKKILEIEAELLQIENQFQANQQSKISQIRAKQNETKQKISELQFSIETDKKILERNKAELNSIKLQLTDLRKQWVETNQLVPPDDKCPICGRLLPEEIREKTKAKFNVEKSSKLEAIEKQGEELKAKEQTILNQNNSLMQKIETDTQALKQLQSIVAQKEEEITALSQQKVEDDSSYQEKIRDLNKIEALVNTKDIKELEEEINNKKRILFELEQNAKNQARIEELKEQEKEFAKKLEQIEYELNLIDLFYQTQTRMLEEKINSSFQHVKFKLFERQVNGEVVQTCKTLFKGVPYDSVNDAAKINVGLDIINTFSQFYGFAPPIFIDNCESITRLIETKAQTIKLIVSEQDKKLRVVQKEPALVGEPF